MSTYRNFMNIICDKLQLAGLENCGFESREIMGAALECDCRSAEFEKALDKEVSGETASKLLDLCTRRIKGEPLQYLIGEWEFYGLPFKVGEGVLIPRQDTETIVDTAVARLKSRKALTIIDLCAGSGCIGIALEKNLDCEKVVLVEKFPQAMKYLEQNVRLNDSNAEACCGDIFDCAVIEAAPQADLIVCNPPYLTEDDMKNLQTEVAFEPESALYGGEDGLEYYRKTVRLWKAKLKTGGTLIFEIGVNQEQDVMQLMIQHGFKNVRAKKDLCGIYRAVVGEIAGQQSD